MIRQILEWLALKSVGRVPAAFAWAIRQLFPLEFCRSSIHVDALGARFELHSSRAMPALSAIQIKVHNYLPFPVHVCLRRINVVLNDQIILTLPMSESIEAKASGPTAFTLPEAPLAERQVKVAMSATGALLRINLDCICESKVRKWGQSFELKTTVFVYTD